MGQVGHEEREDDSQLAAEVVVWFFADNSLPRSVGTFKGFTDRFRKTFCLG
jgi:hypothetical protein